MVQVQAGVAIRDAGMGAREARVQFNGLGKQPTGELVGALVLPPGELPSAKVELRATFPCPSGTTSRPPRSCR